MFGSLRVILNNVDLVDPLELDKTYQRYTGLSSNIDRFLRTVDGPVLMVAKLPHIFELHDQGGKYLVSASMASHTLRPQFEQQCSLYFQCILDNVDGARDRLRDRVKDIKQALRQQGQQRADQWYVDFDMHNYQLFP